MNAFRSSLLSLPVMLCMSVLPAQQRISDEIIVTLPNAVHVGERSLPAGEYRIRQIPSASNPRILEFVNKEGQTVETTVSAVPALNNSGAPKTMVELKQSGGRQYVSHLWIEGKAYGYELPAPKEGSGNTSSAALQATYTPRQEVAQNTPAPAPEATPAPEPAQPAQPEPVAEPAPAPQPAPVAEAPQPVEAPAMPATADGTIAAYLLSGAFLVALGLWRRPTAGK